MDANLPTPETTQDEAAPHRAGFVSLVGRPNAGKSTLLNALMGEKLSAVTYKAQTTRHRIFGIFSESDLQIVYSDTPGILEASYELHKQMMRFVHESLDDSDLLLLLVDVSDPKEAEDPILKMVARAQVPVFLILNKMDADKKGSVDEVEKRILEWLTPAQTFRVSALTGEGVSELKDAIIARMPEHPPYFDKEQLSDRTERFFASEIIREKIFTNYRQEVPYACDVVVEAFKEEETIIRIRAEILVERQTQKGIIIGKAGEALKKTGTEARLELEKFFNKKIFLELYVRVKPDWRNHKAILRQLGYAE